MKKVKRVTLTEGVEFLKEEGMKVAEEATSRALYGYQNNKSLLAGAGLLNLANTFIDNAVLENITDIVNVVTVAKVGFDMVTVEVEDAPASDKNQSAK